MKTYSYVSMADLLQQAPGITEGVILDLAAENRIPQPVDANLEEGIPEATELRFPSITKDVLAEAYNFLVLILKKGMLIGTKEAVSLGIHHKLLPLYSGLWLELYERGEFSEAIHEKVLMLNELHAPTTFDDLESRSAELGRNFRIVSIIEKGLDPFLQQEFDAEDLADAIDYMKSDLVRRPVQDRLNTERKISCGIDRLVSGESDLAIKIPKVK